MRGFPGIFTAAFLLCAALILSASLRADFLDAEHSRTRALVEAHETAAARAASAAEYGFPLRENPSGETFPRRSAFPLTLAVGAALLTASGALLFLRARKERRSRAGAFVLASRLCPSLEKLREDAEKIASRGTSPDARRVPLRTLREETEAAVLSAENFSRLFALRENRRGGADFPHVRLPAEDFVFRAACRAVARLEDAGGDVEISVAPELRSREISAPLADVELILFNLADNAARFASSPAGTFAEIRVSERGGATEIRFSDDGPGISEAARERLFAPPPDSVGEDSATPHCGFGLGVSRLVSRSFGGDLSLEKSDDAGTRFLLKIPTDAAPRRSRAIASGKISAAIFVCLAATAAFFAIRGISLERGAVFRGTRAQSERFSASRERAESRVRAAWRRWLDAASSAEDFASENFPEAIRRAVIARFTLRGNGSAKLSESFSVPADAAPRFLAPIFPQLALRVRMREPVAGGFRPLLLASARGNDSDEPPAIAHELFLVRFAEGRSRDAEMLWLDKNALAEALTRAARRECPTARVAFFAPAEPVRVEAGALWTEYQPWRITPEGVIDLGGFRVRVLQQFYADDAGTPPSVRVARALIPATAALLILCAFGFFGRASAKRRGLFAEAVAHELKTPLARVRARLDRLSRADGNANSAETFAAEAARFREEIERAAQVAENMRALFRAEKTPRPMPARERMTAEDFVAATTARSAERLKEAGLRAEISVAQELRSRERVLRVRASMVEQVVFILADNAAKHGGGNAVGIAFRVAGTRLEIRVSDGGNGLRGGAFPRGAFRPFSRGAGSRGSGLGLAVARMIARELGGSLSAKKSGSAGTVFSFKIPA